MLSERNECQIHSFQKRKDGIKLCHFKNAFQFDHSFKSSLNRGINGNERLVVAGSGNYPVDFAHSAFKMQARASSSWAMEDAMLKRMGRGRQ